MSAWTGLANDIFETELPHYAFNPNAPDDAFFTHPHVAKRCYGIFREVCKKEDIDLSRRVFIEPSAGEGCFLRFLPPRRRIGLDINPRGNSEIQQADFLKWVPKAGREYVFIGNPPFGHRGAMAMGFIRRAFLFADIVAFILPVSFYSNGKGSNMKRVQNDPDGHSKATLIHNEVLAKDSFYYPDSREGMLVNSVFQVWVKGESSNKVFTDYDVSEFARIYSCCSNPNRFCGLGRGRKYDCFIDSTFFKNTEIVDVFEKVRYGSGFGIRILKRKREILAMLRKVDWRKHSSEATNHCRHVRMHHIREVLGQAGYGVPA